MKLIPLLVLLVSASDSSSQSRSSDVNSCLEIESSKSGENSLEDPIDICDLLDSASPKSKSLALALWQRDSNLIDELLCDPEIAFGIDSDNAVGFAVRNCSINLTLKIFARVDPSTNDDALLKTVCAEGHFQAVSILLCDPRVDPTRDNFKALIGAAAHGHYSVFQLLLTDFRVPFENPFVKNAVDLMISELEIDENDQLLNLALILRFKRTRSLQIESLVGGWTILSIGMLAISHGVVDVIDQIQWLLVNEETDDTERKNIFAFLLQYSASRNFDEIMSNILRQAHSLGDLCSDSFQLSLLQGCRFGYKLIICTLLKFAKNHLYDFNHLIDSTLLNCRRYGQHQMAKPILDSFLGLTLGTASDTINAQMVNLSGYDSSLFYSEVLLKLRLAAEWAQRALGTDFPDELLEYLFYWYFY